MKTKYKHIHFVQAGTKGNWFCQHSNTRKVLGEVSHYPPWRQYIFEAPDCCAFSADCLRDIAHFLEQLNKEAG